MDAIDLRSFPDEQLDNWFSYHNFTPQQIDQSAGVRIAARAFAETVNRCVPAGPDKSAAMRLIREAMMTANGGIACHVEPA